MSGQELIEKLTDSLSKALRPSIPLQIDLWDIDTIAKFLKRDASSVRMRVACLPDFPKAIRLPSATGKRSHALYKATEVIGWTEKHRDRH